MGSQKKTILKTTWVDRCSLSPSWPCLPEMVPRSLTTSQCCSSTRSQGTVWLSSVGHSSNKPSLPDLFPALETDLARKLIQVLLIWLLLGLLQMPELELLLPGLSLMPELLLLPELLQQDHPNWTLLSRLVFRRAGTLLASAEIHLYKLESVFCYKCHIYILFIILKWEEKLEKKKKKKIPRLYSTA